MRLLASVFILATLASGQPLARFPPCLPPEERVRNLELKSGARVPLSIQRSPRLVESAVPAAVAGILISEVLGLNVTFVPRPPRLAQLSLLGCGESSATAADAVRAFDGVYAPETVIALPFRERCPRTAAARGESPWPDQRRLLRTVRGPAASLNSEASGDDPLLDAPHAMVDVHISVDATSWAPPPGGSAVSSLPIAHLGQLGTTTRASGVHAPAWLVQHLWDSEGLQLSSWQALQSPDVLDHFPAIPAIPRVRSEARTYEATLSNEGRQYVTTVDGVWRASGCPQGSLDSMPNGTCVIVLAGTPQPLHTELFAANAELLGWNASAAFVGDGALFGMASALLRDRVPFLLFHPNEAVRSMFDEAAFTAMALPEQCTSAGSPVPAPLRLWRGHVGDSGAECDVPTLAPEKQAWGGLLELAPRAQKLIDRMTMTNRDVEFMSTDARRSVHASGNTTAAHSLACEWVTTERDVWRAWIPALPPCTEDDWDYALADRCVDRFLTHRPVHFTWRHPHPQDPGTPTNCEGGKALPTDVSVLCGHINARSGYFILHITVRGLALLATLLACAVLLLRGHYRHLRKRLFGVSPEWLLLFFTLAAGSSFLSMFSIAGQPSASSCTFRGLVPGLVALFISHLFCAILWTVCSYSAGSDGGEERAGRAGFDSVGQLNAGGDSASTLPTRLDTGRTRNGVHIVARTRSGEFIPAGAGANTSMSSGAGTLCLIFSVFGFEVCVIVLVMIASGGGNAVQNTQMAWFGTYTQTVCGIEGGGILFSAVLVVMILLSDGVALAVAASTARHVSALRSSTERFLARAVILATRLLAGMDLVSLAAFTGTASLSSSVRLVVASTGFTVKTVLVLTALLWPFFTTVVFGRPAPVYKGDLASFSLITGPDELEHLEGKIASHFDGSVYQARWRGRDAVIKQPANQALSRGAIYSVRAYCLRMASMRHPNVCALFALCESPLYLVMEHAPQGSLLTVVESVLDAEGGQQRRVMRTAISVATDAARGMRYLHERGQLHGSLTPQNVLVSQTGRGLVSDAGYRHSVLSHLHAPRASSSSGGAPGEQAGAGAGLFTAAGGGSAVSAPEVLRGERDSCATDVYSWGMVLHFAVFCQLPFASAVPESVPLMIMRGDMPTRQPGLQQNESLTEYQQAQMVDLMESCWEPDPANRPTFGGIERRLPLIMSREAMTAGDSSSDLDTQFGLEGANSYSSDLVDSANGSASAPFVHHRCCVAVPSARPALPPVRLAGPRSCLPEVGPTGSEPEAPRVSPALAPAPPVNGPPATTTPANAPPATTTPANAPPATTTPANAPPATTTPANATPASTSEGAGSAATDGSAAHADLPVVHSMDLAQRNPRRVAYSQAPAAAHYSHPTAVAATADGVTPPLRGPDVAGPAPSAAGANPYASGASTTPVAGAAVARTVVASVPDQAGAAGAPPDPAAAAPQGAQTAMMAQMLQLLQQQQEMQQQQQEMQRALAEEREAREALVRELERRRAQDEARGRGAEAGAAATGAAPQRQRHQQAGGASPAEAAGGGDGRDSSAPHALMDLAGAETRQELETAGVDTSRLELGPVIGKGQFGLIMKGTYDGQEVAVKQLNISHTRQASRHLFLKECKIMLSVRHPNVVRVVGTAQQDETLLLVMELCTRGDLFHLVQRSRRRRRVKDHFRFVIHVLINIAEGMAHLHSQRVLHRDLKSMNVLLSQSWAAKVSDFGLSRVLLEHSAKTMTRCGSPIWAAPEILRGERYNELVDVYSFAIIAFECGEWTTPYPRKMTGLQIMQAVAFRGMRPTKRAQWPRELWELVTTSWEDDAARRPTFKSVVSTLKELWENQEETLKDVA